MSAMPIDFNLYYSSKPPPPPNILGGQHSTPNSRGLEPDPGDPGPVLPLHAFPPSVFDTPSIQDLNALKAHVEALANLCTVLVHDSPPVGFDPGLASPDSAAAESSPSACTLTSPTSSTFSLMGAYCMSPDSLLPSPTSSAFASASPPSPFGSSPSTYSPEEYRSQPVQSPYPPIQPPAYPYKEGYIDAGPPPVFGPRYGIDPSALSLPPPAMPPEPVVLSGAGPFAPLPAYAGHSGPHVASLPLHRLHLPMLPTGDTQSSPQVATPPWVEAVCPLCGQEFKHKRNLKPHLRVIHDPNYSRHDCPYCPASYSRNGDLKNHMKNKHNNPPNPGL